MDAIVEAVIRKLYYIYGILAGLGAVCFGAGIVVEKSKKDKYVTNREFDAYRALFDSKLDTIKESVDDVKEAMGLPKRDFIIKP